MALPKPHHQYSERCAGRCSSRCEPSPRDWGGGQNLQWLGRLRDPAAAEHDVAVVENGGLPGRDGALRIIEGYDDFVVRCLFDYGRRWLVTMANLHRDALRLAQIIHRNQVDPLGAQCTRVQMLVSTYNYPLVRAADLDDVERRSRRHTESLALSHGEIVNTGVLSNDLAIRSYQLPSSVRQRFALLGKVGINETLVVASGDKADFL